MTERPNLGQILMGLGRIDDADVARALDHQRQHGGYFGEALLALGLVSKDELEWGLASQFDIPYIFPDADAIDPDAASLVSPEWALAHLTMPILLTDDTLTVVVDSPVRTQAIEELAQRTDRDLELALASGERIRELIQKVYTRAARAAESGRPAPTNVGTAMSLALEVAAPRFGVSVRRHRAWFWYDDGGTIRRRPLDGNWAGDLDRVISPPPSARVGSTDRVQFKGSLNRDGIVTPVRVEYLAGAGGREYLFQPLEERSALHDRFPAPPPGVAAEIRLLARSGSARFAVTADPDDLGSEILPYLPTLLLDPSWRAVHLQPGAGGPAEEVFLVRLPQGGDERLDALEELREFGFDAVTIDLGTAGLDMAEPAVDAAAVAFLLWPAHGDRRRAYEAGIRWELHIERTTDGRLDWSLEPLRT